MHRLFALLLALTCISPVYAEEVIDVTGDAELRAALDRLRPGVRVRIAPGKYRGPIWLSNVHGTAERPIVIEGADPRDPPYFVGGKEGWHLGDCSYLALRCLNVRGQSAVGVHVDDEGSFATPSHHIMLEHIHVSDIGPKGMHDAIKLTGVDTFLISNCTANGWGCAAINLLGSRHGVVRGCTFRGAPGYSQLVGVQTKGGCNDITIHQCRFFDAGVRAIQIGGFSSPQFLRPSDSTSEAHDIRVSHCTIVGSETAVSFVGVDGAEVAYNTIYHPGQLPLRILQENRIAQMVPSRTGYFHHNLIVYRHADVGVMVNVGDATDPDSFRFASNAWYSQDRPQSSRPQLPTEEVAGVYGVDPQLANPAQEQFAPQTFALQDFGSSAER